VSSLLLRGFVLGFAVAATPGPIFFLCLRRAVVRGWLNGLVSGFGVATADGFYAAVAAFGISVITAAISGEKRWLALGGGASLGNSFACSSIYAHTRCRISSRVPNVSISYIAANLANLSFDRV